MLSSRVKISYFRAKAFFVFHWCLYNKRNLFSCAKVKFRPGVTAYTRREIRIWTLDNKINSIFRPAHVLFSISRKLLITFNNNRLAHSANIYTLFAGWEVQKVKDWLRSWKCYTDRSLGLFQTSDFSCAESNVNEVKQQNLLICIRFGTGKVRRLKRALAGR